MPTDLIPDIYQAIQGGQSWEAYVLLLTFALAVLALPQARHQRNRKSVINAIVWSFFVFVLYFETNIGLLIFGICVFLSIVFIWIGFWVRHNPLYWEGIILSRLEVDLHKMRYAHLEAALQSRPKYMLSLFAQVQWVKITANLYYQKKEFYNSLSSCRQAQTTLPLTDEEKGWFISKKIFCLWHLGDTSKAKSQLDVNKRLIPSHTVYYLQGLIHERRGQLGQSKDDLLQALKNIPDGDQSQRKYLYNDIGRIQGILGNSLQQLHFYEKAARAALADDDKFLAHISIPNLVESALLVQESAKAWEWLEVYKELYDENEVNQRLEYFNCQLNLARQFGDRNWLLNILEWGEKSLQPKEKCAEKAIFDKSTLRIRYHNNAGWKVKLNEIRGNLDAYLQMDFPVNYEVAKEVWGIIRDLVDRGIMIPQRKSDDDFLQQVFEFRKSCWDKIEEHKLSLPDECVFEWCYWESELAELRKNCIENATNEQVYDTLKKILSHLENIARIHKEHGNAIEAFSKHMHIADEAMHYSMQSRYSMASSYFQDQCSKYTEVAAIEVKEFSQHPAVLEAMIVLAKLYAFLDNREQANAHFQIFEDSQLKLEHLARWVRQYYYQVRNYLQAVDAGKQRIRQNEPTATAPRPGPSATWTT